MVINWTFQAKADLKDIFNFISKNSSKYAHLQIYKIRKKVQSLKTVPNIGKINTDFNDETIREIIIGNYRVFYRIISNERIDIILVHHGARDLRKRF